MGKWTKPTRLTAMALAVLMALGCMLPLSVVHALAAELDEPAEETVAVESVAAANEDPAESQEPAEPAQEADPDQEPAAEQEEPEQAQIPDQQETADEEEEKDDSVQEQPEAQQETELEPEAEPEGDAEVEIEPEEEIHGTVTLNLSFVTAAGDVVAVRELHKDQAQVSLEDLEALLGNDYAILGDRLEVYQALTAAAQTSAETGNTVDVTVAVARLIGLSALPLFGGSTVTNGLRRTRANAAAAGSIPASADIFFNAADEIASFNVQHWYDAYAQTLVGADNSANHLKLSSSTDGALVDLPGDNYGETGGNSTNGVLRIDYETGPATTYNNKGGASVTYSDGAYTIVGWGGNFKLATNKNSIDFWMKSGDSVDIDTILSYVTIRLYYQGTQMQTANLGSGEFDLKKVDGAVDGNGYQKYSLKLRDSGSISIGGDGQNSRHWLQGIKFCFDRYVGADYKKGTLLVEKLTVYTDNAGDSPRFSPFAYNTNKDYLMSVVGDTATYGSIASGGVLPFLRDEGTAIQDGDRSGRNRSKYDGDWHMWTMSTSDGNIVTAANAGTDRTALQIKYSNQNGHKTFTNLEGDVDKTGEWLVVTLKGDGSFNENIAIDLYNDGVKQASIPFSSFQTSMDNTGKDTNIANGYRTVYYKLNDQYTFDSVKFNFDNINENTTTARKMFVSEIYLLNPVPEITKAVDKETAHGGDTVTYTLTITNTGEVLINNATVEDVIPSDYDISTVNVIGGTKNTTTRVASWEIGPLAKGESTTLTFTAKVGDDYTGVITNRASITKVNQKDLTSGSNSVIWSNTVTTTVQNQTLDEYVFYAEVGQTTDLPIALGQTTSISYTDKYWTTVYSGTIRLSGNNSTADGSVTLRDVPEGAEIRLTGPTNGGFIIDYINMNGSQVYSSGDSMMRGTGYSLFEGGDYWHHLSSFGAQGAYMLMPSATGDVTFSMRAKLWGSHDFVYNVWKEVDDPNSAVTTMTNDTFQSIPTTGTAAVNATINANGAVGNNNATLKYKSSAPGKDEFNITVNQGGVNKQVKVVVYNYKVADHAYVLDYGLSVKLSDMTNQGEYDLLENAVLSLPTEAASDRTTWAFSGFYQNQTNNDLKRNADNATADSADYVTPYGSASLSLKNGSAAYSGAKDTLKVTFTPSTFMSSVDTFYYGVQVSKDGATDLSSAKTATPVMEGKIQVMPASVVYYEDNFTAVSYSGDTQTAGTFDEDRTQSNDQSTQFGYDLGYIEDYLDSAGSSTIMTAQKEGGKYTTKATFTFKGTGFDIVGRSTSESTGLTYIVANPTTKAVVKMGVVDTLYTSGDLFQTPVIRVRDLAYNEYVVTLTAVFSGVDPDNEAAGPAYDTFYLDGIRIYDPLGTAGNAEYNTNDRNEQGATITNVYPMIVGNGGITETGSSVDDGVAGYTYIPGSTAAILYYDDTETLASGNMLQSLPVTVTETLGDAADTTHSVLRYMQAGPDNEVYLEEGGAFAILVKPDGSVSDVLLQIEAKAVSVRNEDGDGVDAPDGLDLCMISYDGTPVSLLDGEELSTATAMYYNIDLSNAIRIPGAGFLVVIVGSDSFPYAVSISNVKSKGCTIANPLSDANADATDSVIDQVAPEEVQFVSLTCKTASPVKGSNVNFELVVSDELDGQLSGLTSKQLRTAFQITANEGTANISAVKRTSAGHYTITFKAPKALGTFPIVVQTVGYGDESAYISTDLTIKK